MISAKWVFRDIADSDSGALRTLKILNNVQ